MTRRLGPTSGPAGDSENRSERSPRAAAQPRLRAEIGFFSLVAMADDGMPPEAPAPEGEPAAAYDEPFAAEPEPVAAEATPVAPEAVDPPETPRPTTLARF